MAEKLTHVLCDDWEGLYLGDKLICEGHRIRLDDALQKLGHKVETKSVDEGWLEETSGSLPSDLDDVVFDENDDD